MSPHAPRFRAAVLATVAAAVAVAGGVVAPSATAAPAKPTVVLVHGAWADASSWATIASRLQADGYTVLAPPTPLRGLAYDAAALTAFVAARTTGPVLLVGHSYGGAVITNAARRDPDVVGLVFVDAFLPKTGDSVLSLLANGGGGGDPTALFDAVPYPGAQGGDVDLYVKQELFGPAVAADLPAATIARLAASQRPIRYSALAEPSRSPRWKVLPSWCLLGTDDQIIPLALQTSMARRAGCTVKRTASSHLSPLSRPAAVVALVETAARSVA